MMNEPKQAAFMKAFNPCRDTFYRYCQALAYGKMNAEDLMQDVLLSAYERYENIRKKDQLLHYLIRAARFRSISLWRKSRFRAEMLDQHQEKLQARGASPEILPDIELLYRKLDQLPEKQKDALIMFEITGLSMKEIAEIQNSNEGAIKTKISRGRQKLRKMMSDKRSFHWFLLFLPQQPFTKGSCTSCDMVFKLLRELPIPEASQQWGAFLSTSSAMVSGGMSLANHWSWLPALKVGTGALVIGLGASVLYPTLNQSSHSKAVWSHSIPKSHTPARPKQIKPLALEVQTPDFPHLNTPRIAQLFSWPSQKNVGINPEASAPKELNLSELNTFPLGNEQLPDSKLLAPVQAEPIPDCGKEFKFKGDIKQFRRNVQLYLKKDGLISSNTKEIVMSFVEKEIKVNGKLIPSDKQARYLELFLQYDIFPCYKRIAEITQDYIAVGDISEKGFSGRINGRADLDMLNKKHWHLVKQTAMGKEEYEERKVEPFDHLDIRGVAVVHLVEGDSKVLKVRASGMPIRDIETRVRNGTLYIDTEGQPSGEKIHIEVSSANLEDMVVGGAAELYTDDLIKTQNLNITVEDVGAAWLKIDTEKVKVYMRGGDLSLSGQTREKEFFHEKNASRGTLKTQNLRQKR